MKLITIEKDIYRISDNLYNKLIKAVEEGDESARDSLLYCVTEKCSVLAKLDSMFNW